MSQPDDQVSINIFDLIDSICADFRKQWKSGKRPKVQSLLDRVPENARETLLRNLLAVEIRYRQRAGEKPSSDDYLKRFPHFRRVVGDAFYQSTSMSIEALHSTPADDSHEMAVTVAAPGANQLGDYELIRELGRGGFGVVYEAKHSKRNNRVALKTLPTGQDGQQINADRLHKFRREFRSLSEYNHPNLVGMQTLEVDGSQWFFTMDLIDGMDFLSYVRPDESLDEVRLRKSFCQLVGGVMALHKQGIVHRDLKPSNVMVDPSGHVTILDFGLVAELQTKTDQTASLKSAMFAGTPRYAAPEQMFGDRSEASDWYALGVMLYEAMTGDAPFTGNQMELLRQKQYEDPPILSGRDDLPKDLAALTDALLKREPTGRPTVQAIVETLGLDLQTKSHDSAGKGEADAFSEESESEQILIGREEQLAQLEAARQELLAKRQPVVVWITGLSGEGKSSLVESFLRPLRHGSEMLVLSGRCYDRESVPFKVIDSQIDALVRYLRSRPTDEVQQLLPNDIEMLAHLFPLLRRVEPINLRCKLRISGLEDRQIRNLAFAAFRDLLVAISRKTPIVMFVDDLQWGDADSAGVLVDVLSPPSPPAMLLLGSFRSDEMEGSAFLREWNDQNDAKKETLRADQVAVEPLTESECRSFLRNRFGDENEVIECGFAQLFANTKGNPYFLEQLIEGYDPQTGQFQTIPLSEIIENRLGRCPAEAKKLLDVIAVAGKAASALEIIEVAGESSAAFATLTHMRSERLVRLVGSQNEQLVDTYHDKIRESCLQRMEPGVRRKLHRQFGLYIEQRCDGVLDSIKQGILSRDSNNSRVFDLAYHFHQADDARAFYYQLAAGQAALSAFATEDAFDYLTTARALKPEILDASLQFKFDFLSGDAAYGTKRLEESLGFFRAALVSAPTAVDRAKCHWKLGLAIMDFDYRESKQEFDKALAQIGERQPQSSPMKLLRTGVNLLKFHLIPHWFPGFKGRSLGQEEDVLRSAIYNMYAYMIPLDVLTVLYSMSRRSVIAKFGDDLGAKAIAYSSYGLSLAMGGAAWLGQHYSRKGVHFAELCDADEAKIVTSFNVGVFNFFAGKLKLAMILLGNSLGDFERRNEIYNLGLSIHWIRHVCSAHGSAVDIIKWSKREKEVGHQTGKLWVAMSEYGLADGFARCGRLEEAFESGRASFETLDANGLFLKGIARQELGRAQIQASDFDKAIETLQENRSYIQKEWLAFEIFLDTYPLLLEAKLSDLWSPGRRSTPSHRLSFVDLLMTRLIRTLFPTLRAHCYRVLGRAATSKGRLRNAFRQFDLAIVTATKNGAEYERARTLIDKSMLDYPEAQFDREKGLVLLESLGCVLPDAEVEYLGIDREAHHARAAAARESDVAEHENG